MFFFMGDGLQITQIQVDTQIITQNSEPSGYIDFDCEDNGQFCGCDRLIVDFTDDKYDLQQINSPSQCTVTLNPTLQPSLSPTENPTRKPTRNPTQIPTQEPTRNPTMLPTNQPS